MVTSFFRVCSGSGSSTSGSARRAPMVARVDALEAPPEAYVGVLGGSGGPSTLQSLQVRGVLSLCIASLSSHESNRSRSTARPSRA